MVVTTTAVAFTLLGAGLGFFGWQFFRAFSISSGGSKKINSLLATFLSVSALQNLVLGLGAFFFFHNESALRAIMLLTQILLSAHSVLGIYTLYYIFFPSTSRFLALTAAIAIGLTGSLLTVFENPPPFLTAQNGIEWDMSPALSSITFMLLLLSIGSFIYIFFRLYRDSVSKQVKRFAFILFLAGAVGLASTFTRFIFFQKNPSDISRGILDTGIGIAGVIFIVALIFASTKPNRESISS